MKRNVLLSLLLSFGIMLVGGVVWGLFYYIGVFASIISLASAYLAILVYSKFSKTNALCYVWVSVLSILINAFALILTLSLMTSESILSIFNILATNTNVLLAVCYDEIMAIVFTLLGVVVSIATFKRKEKLEKEKQAKLLEAQKNITSEQPIENKEIKRCDYCGAILDENLNCPNCQTK